MHKIFICFKICHLLSPKLNKIDSLCVFLSIEPNGNKKKYSKCLKNEFKYDYYDRESPPEVRLHRVTETNRQGLYVRRFQTHTKTAQTLRMFVFVTIFVK